MIDWNSTFDIIVKILASCILGACIGFERKSSGHDAGIRTYMLVTLSSTLFMILSVLMFTEFDGKDSPSRVAAQVISGLGFIGAGVILRSKEKNTIRGLTTSALIFFSGAIGLFIGIGKYFIPIFSVIIVEILLYIIHKIDYEKLDKEKR